MGEKTSQVPEFSLLKPMDLLVLNGEQFHIFLLVQFKELTVPLTNMTIVIEVSSVLHAAFNNHIA